MGADQIEDQVVARVATGKIVLGIVHRPVGADRADHVDIARAAHAGHLGAEGLGDLHREGADAARRAVDQDLLPGPDPGLVAQALQRREAGDRGRGRLRERQAGLRASLDSAAQANSASAPRPDPNTASPGLNRVTPAPTASTTPATSTPGRVSFGLVRPKARRAIRGLPFIRCASSGLTDAARTAISTSPSPGMGVSTSSIRITSGGP